MHDLTTFERDLADRLAAELAGQIRPFDPSQIAGAAMVRRNPVDELLNGLRAGEALPIRASRKAVLLAIAAMLILATVVLAVGASQLGGPYLALLRPNGDLVDVVLAHSDGSNQNVIGQFPYSPLRNELSWSPGGEHLAMFGEDWQLTIVDRGGRVVSQRKLEDRGSQFAWSPDGQRLAIYDGAWLPDGASNDGPPLVQPHLDVVALNGQVEVTAELPDALRYSIGLGGVAWSRDGRHLAISGFLFDPNLPLVPSGIWRSSIWIVDGQTGSVRDIEGADGAAGNYMPAWLPDGRVLVMRQAVGLVAIDPATGAESVAYEFDRSNGGSGFMHDWAVSPDGTRVAMIAPAIGLAVLDLASGAVHEVPAPRDPGVGGGPPLSWSPSGTSLLLRVGEVTDEPFFATQVGQIDVITGDVTVLATEVIDFGVRN